MQAESTTNERGTRPRGKNMPSWNHAPMLQAVKQVHSQCYIARKHAQINRQPRRLEFTLSHTKQTPAAQINRQQIATSKITHSRISNHHNQHAEQALSRHSSLATRHCRSNRHTPRLESAISHRKQTLGASSNRHFLQVSASHQLQIAATDRPPQGASNIVSNRRWQILEINVNLSKQTIAPRSNRHKNAMFASRMGQRDAILNCQNLASQPRVTNHESPITNHYSPITAVCASVKPMREYPHAKNTK
jgi:hypothetical protein